MGRVVVALALVSAGIVAALIWSQQRDRPRFISGTIEAHAVRVGSRVGGRVRTVHVQEGRQVNAGDLLVELEPYDLEEQLREAQALSAAHAAQLRKLQAGNRPEEIAQSAAARDRAQAAHDKVIAGPRALEIELLEHKLEVAQAEFAKAQQDYEKVARLIKTQQATPEEYDEKTREFNTARGRLNQAEDELALAREGSRGEEKAEARAALAEREAGLRLMERGARVEDIAQAQAELAAAEARVARIERQIAELRVLAPYSAIVEAIDLRPGDLVAPGAPVVALVDPTVLWVRAFAPESELNLALGQKAEVRVDAWPRRRFAAHVTYVAREGEFTPANIQTPEERGKQVYRVKVELDEGLDVLRAGMAADVFFPDAAR